MNIELTVKNFSGEAFKITGLTLNSTLDQLITKVQEKYNNVTKNSITLVLNGTPIVNDYNPQTLQKTLQSLNISNKQTIFVVFRVAGG